MENLKDWQLKKLNESFLGKSNGLMKLLEKGEISTSLEIPDNSNEFEGFYNIKINSSLNFFRKFLASSYISLKFERKSKKSENTYSYGVCLPTKNNNILKWSSDSLDRIHNLDLEQARKDYGKLSAGKS